MGEENRGKLRAKKRRKRKRRKGNEKEIKTRTPAAKEGVKQKEKEG